MNINDIFCEPDIGKMPGIDKRTSSFCPLDKYALKFIGEKSNEFVIVTAMLTSPTALGFILSQLMVTLEFTKLIVGGTNAL